MVKTGFIKYFILTFFSVTFGCVICNFIVDPLQYYRRNLAYPLYENDRWQVAAFIRSFPFDTVLVGTSMTQNFSLENVREQLGSSPIKLSIAGATIPEQITVVKAAIKSGKAKKIIWGIDRYFFHDSKNALNAEFPLALYEGKISAHLKYLLNLDMLSQSVKLILGSTGVNFLKLPQQELETYNFWCKDANFSKAAVLQEYKNTLLKKKKARDHGGRRTVLKSFIALILSHPEIEFILFFPPHSLAWYKLEYYTNEKEYYEDVAFRKELLETLTEIKNAKIFDFETDINVVSFLDNYKDLSHYSQKINNYIIDCISKNRKLISSKDILKSQVDFLNLPNQPFR